MKQKYIFAFIGIAASGKTNLVKYVCDKHGFVHLPTVKTRKRRPDDIDQTIHVTKPVFEEMIKNAELLEYTIFNNHYYGTPKDLLVKNLNEANVSYAITADKIAELKAFWPNTVAILVSPQEPILETVKNRLVARSTHPDERLDDKIKTIEKDLIEIEEAKSKNLIDYFVTTLDQDFDAAFIEVDELVKRVLG